MRARARAAPGRFKDKGRESNFFNEFQRVICIRARGAERVERGERRRGRTTMSLGDGEQKRPICASGCARGNRI